MRNTRQKQIIGEVVRTSCDHPSAQTVYERAHARLSSINTATTYRVLSELVKSGDILKIDTSDGSHYDKTAYPHAHFLCTVCGEVVDVALDNIKEMYASSLQARGCSVVSVNLLLTGVCEKCNKKL